MDDATQGPQRMRYSFESRCRAVAAMVAGLSPGVAAQAIGASRATGYRWWRRYVTAGWVGLQERPSTPQHQPRGGGGDPRRAPAQRRAASHARGAAGPRPALRLGARRAHRGAVAQSVHPSRLPRRGAPGRTR